MHELSKPVLIALSLVCLVCLVGVGFVVRDVAISLGATGHVPAIAGIGASLAAALVLKMLIWRLGTRR
ncbi:MAG: hypothetical protein R3D27_06375 [Hyphomicrobiaceae bacterium]